MFAFGRRCEPPTRRERIRMVFNGVTPWNIRDEAEKLQKLLRSEAACPELVEELTSRLETQPKQHDVFSSLLDRMGRTDLLEAVDGCVRSMTLNSLAEENPVLEDLRNLGRWSALRTVVKNKELQLDEVVKTATNKEGLVMYFWGIVERAGQNATFNASWPWAHTIQEELKTIHRDTSEKLKVKIEAVQKIFREKTAPLCHDLTEQLKNMLKISESPEPE